MDSRLISIDRSKAKTEGSKQNLILVELRSQSMRCCKEFVWCTYTRSRRAGGGMRCRRATWREMFQGTQRARKCLEQKSECDLEVNRRIFTVDEHQEHIHSTGHQTNCVWYASSHPMRNEVSRNEEKQRVEHSGLNSIMTQRGRDVDNIWTISWEIGKHTVPAQYPRMSVRFSKSLPIEGIRSRHPKKNQQASGHTASMCSWNRVSNTGATSNVGERKIVGCSSTGGMKTINMVVHQNLRVVRQQGLTTSHFGWWHPHSTQGHNWFYLQILQLLPRKGWWSSVLDATPVILGAWKVIGWWDCKAQSLQRSGEHVDHTEWPLKSK